MFSQHLAFFLTTVFLMCCAHNTYAARILISGYGYTVLADDDYQCGIDLNVISLADSKQMFSGDRINLQRVLAGYTSTLGVSCPQARKVLVHGQVNGIVAFEGKMLKSNGWRLDEIQKAYEDAQKQTSNTNANTNTNSNQFDGAPLVPYLDEPVAQSYPPLSATTAGKSRNNQSDLQNLEIQKLLTDLGYDPGPANGVIGRKTRQAIYEYQRSAGMGIDGQPSAKLLLSLRSHNLSSIGPNSNSKPLNTEEIIEIQQILTGLGFAPGSVDGDVNARTESAIYAYQREFSLPADGKPSMSLITSLRSQISSNKNSTRRRLDLPPIRVPLASNLRRSEITLYYECEREMNAERRNEGLPDIKLITQKEALRDAQEKRKRFVADATKHMMTQGGTSGLGVPKGRSYLDAMADQSNMLVSKQLARANKSLSEHSNIQKEHEEQASAMLELKICVNKKMR